MTDPSAPHGRCNVLGRPIYPDRKTAQEYAKKTQRLHHGRGKAYWCIFCEHYHITRSYMGRSGRRGGK